MKVLCVIPSRIHSTRLARKALLPIRGKPMVQHTYENARQCSKLAEVVVATDSEEIASVITNINGKVMMTPSSCLTGSDRVALVAQQFPEMDVVINLQGDEPFIKPSMLELLIAPYFAGENPDMTTLAYPLAAEKYQSAGAVKVVTDLQYYALYFSRSPIPHGTSDFVSLPVYNHMGLYAFRRDFLLTYTNLPQTPLEKIESLEQLRALEHGYKIRVCLTAERTLEVNTQAEYEEALRFQ